MVVEKLDFVHRVVTERGRVHDDAFHHPSNPDLLWKDAKRERDIVTSADTELRRLVSAHLEVWVVEEADIVFSIAGVGRLRPRRRATPGQRRRRRPGVTTHGNLHFIRNVPLGLLLVDYQATVEGSSATRRRHRPRHAALHPSRVATASPTASARLPATSSKGSKGPTCWRECRVGWARTLPTSPARPARSTVRSPHSSVGRVCAATSPISPRRCCVRTTSPPGSSRCTRPAWSRWTSMP